VSDLLPLRDAIAGPARGLGRAVLRLMVLWICSTLAISQVARAEDGAGMKRPPAEALDHYNRGRAHYQAGRYREAVGELERALELDPSSPNLVYNLARVYELLGDIGRALPRYEQYREMLPASEIEERARVDNTIQRLHGARAELQQQPERDLRAPTELTARTERGVADAAFWTLASFSLAALAAGAVTGALALRDEKASQTFVLGADGDLGDRNRLADRADKLALISDVSVGVGAVGGLTSILLYALRTRTIIEPKIEAARGGFILGVRGSL
jgi:tetratricopeptide (TPR) repeat protein